MGWGPFALRRVLGMRVHPRSVFGDGRPFLCRVLGRGALSRRVLGLGALLRRVLGLRALSCRVFGMGALSRRVFGDECPFVWRI